MNIGSATTDQLASRVTEASAGSGKTTELIGSIIRVLKSGSSISGVIAVTFTHAAAGEMKLRLRQELETHCNAETDPAIKARLASSLERLEEAFVGMIHSFCGQLLRQRPVEAGIDPNFKDLSPFESGQLFSSVFRKWLGRRLWRTQRPSSGPSLVCSGWRITARTPQNFCAIRPGRWLSGAI